MNANDDVVYQGGQINATEEMDDNPDGQFAFKRKKGCNYHAPLDRISSWAWDSPEDGGMGNKQFRFSLTTLSRPRNFFIGFARRRIGRGGRFVFAFLFTWGFLTGFLYKQIYLELFLIESILHLTMHRLTWNQQMMIGMSFLFD